MMRRNTLSTNLRFERGGVFRSVRNKREIII